MNLIEELNKVVDGSHDSRFQRQKLAEMLGKSKSTVTQILQGRRKIKADELPVIFQFLGRDPAKRMVPVVGYVGARYEIFACDDHSKGAGLDEIEAPPGAAEDAVAVIIRGESMEPAYYEGDQVIYHEKREGDAISDLAGEECVIKLRDGRMFIKTLVPAKAGGHWNLLSHNALPMVDEAVDWAARIEWVKRARRQGNRIGR